MDDSNSTRYTSESYALSGRIMLSAIVILFTVVILILCLHIYARWYLSRTRRRHHDIRHRRRRGTRIIFSNDLVSDATPSVLSRGLDPSVLKSLPTFAFSSATKPEGLECAVCLCEFEENEKARLLPKCNHSFHIECIDMWFHSHSTCPLCRVPVNSEIDVPVREDASVQIVVDSGEVDPRTSSGLCPSRSNAENEMGSSSSSSNSVPSNSSVGSRRKAFELVGISIEVPRRNESFKGMDEELPGSPGGQGLRTPGGRILSFKRILGREKRASTPLSCSSGAEIGAERGEEAEQDQTQSSTPHRIKA